MTILTDESLEFAKAHIRRFYDSDFYPKPFEFEAIWHSWTDARRFLTSVNIHKMSVMPARTEVWPKHHGGYRVVHQLDPVDALVYTALVYQIAQPVEQARHAAQERVACAYRINLDGSSFFGQGNGFDAFRERSIELAEQFGYVLLVDISDFYNQIYLHRVNNAIEHADGRLKGLADDIEWFLGRLNSKVSQGVPVGPAASIVLAEALMIDVDQHVASSGHPHCRYVDDFRIFGNSEDALWRVLKELTLYLYQNHRLSIAHEKTRLVATQDFLNLNINNPYELEKAEVFERIEALGGYGSPEEMDDFEGIEDKEAVEDALLEAFDAMIERRTLDLGYARALLRQARILESEKIAVLILENLSFFAPLANNICVFLNSITNKDTKGTIVPALTSALPFISATNGLLRYWFEWYIAEQFQLLDSAATRACLKSSNHMMSQARSAVLLKDLAWVRHCKHEYFQYGPEDRRAILYASQILPLDERENWLKQVIASSLAPLESWVAQFILDTHDPNFF